jgi:predicted DNA-binding protein
MRTRRDDLDAAICVRIPRVDRDRLIAMARAEDRSTAAVVRRLLQAGLTQMEKV